MEEVAHAWTPAASAQNAFWNEFPGRFITSNEDEICPVALADETSLADLEEFRRVVAHELHHPLQRENPLIHQLKHTDQAELHHRHSAHGSTGSSFFLAGQMGCMVCGHTSDTSIAKGTSQGFAVCICLDGRIALDEASQSRIVSIRVEQVGHAGLCRNLVVVGLEEIQFACCADVCHMKACACLSCQSNSQFCAKKTCLSIADFRVMLDGRVWSIAFLCLRHTPIDASRVLAMCHDGERNVLKDAPQLVVIIHEHVSCTASHEKFDGRRAVRISMENLVEVVVGGSQVESVVDVAFLCTYSVTFLQQRESGGLGNDIGHVKDSGHSSRCCSACLCLHISLGGQAWVAHVNVFVDDAWQEETSLRFHLFLSLEMDFLVVGNAGDASLANEERANKAFSLVDDCGVLDDHFLPRILLRRNFITPKRASLKMPPLILLVPSSRLMKMTGTSFTRNPSCRDVYFISIWKA